MAADLRQRGGHGLGSPFPALCRARSGADHQSEPELARLRVRVPELDQDVAADFLASRTGDLDRQAALDLADELGGLPLALDQAAAYTQSTGGTLGEYLNLFRHRRAELLARGEPTGYSKTVASTWALAFDRLHHISPDAIGILRLLTFYAPEAIPLRLLLQPRPGLAGQLNEETAPVLAPQLKDSLMAGDAIAALRQYSLVTFAGNGSVSMHRLVQAVTLDQMTEALATQWQQAAAVVIDAAIPSDAQQPESWPTFAVLLAHARTAMAYHSDGMGRIASYLGESGSHLAARDEWQRIADARRRAFGPEHPDTLIARANLAWWTGETGDPPAARDLLDALLPVEERVLGPEHPDTLDARYEHAVFTGKAGDPAAARDLLATAAPCVERVLGAEHPNSLICRLELAWWTGDGRRSGHRPRPIRRTATYPRADTWPRPPVYAGCSFRSCKLDREGWRFGRRP